MCRCHIWSELEEAKRSPSPTFVVLPANTEIAQVDRFLNSESNGEKSHYGSLILGIFSLKTGTYQGRMGDPIRNDQDLGSRMTRTTTKDFGKVFIGS
jgi:hypothetical protein